MKNSTRPQVKRLLSLLAMLFVASAMSLNANAQASYNHTYKDGVEVAVGTDYFLYNVGSQMFLTDGMDWGTHATADHAGRKITFAEVASGKYSIYTQSYSVNNDEAAKAGYMTTNGYLDTGTNDANWEFTPVPVDGYTNVYTIKNSDTQYLHFNADDCRVNVGESTNNDYSYWIIVPKTARDAVGDYTYYLMNTDMNRPWERKVWKGFDNNNQVGGNAANRCAERFHAAVDVSQTIAATVPNGRYKLYAQGFWRQDGSAAGPDFYANSDKNTLGSLTGTENSMTDASNSFSAGKYVNSVETTVTDGKLKVGINITDANQWVIFDNFTLDYLGTCLVNDAVALPEGGAMEADTWYYFDIAVAGNEYNATATTLGNIICTDDGTQLTSTATGNVTLTATDNSFAVKRYYVKSSSANNLEIGVASYTYTVSAASVDKAYIQPGQTVTVSYTVSTNDPSATLTQNYSGVTFDGAEINVVPGASGFTFTAPADLAAGTEHTLTIPAEAIGYAAGSTYNEKQNIILNVTAVFDGIYFLKVAATYDGTSEGTSDAVGKYLARGMNYGTHATLDKYGLPVQIATNANNETTIQAYDTKRYFFHANSYDCYADQASLAASGYFTVTLNNGKLLIHNNSMAADTYLKYNTSAASDANIAVFDDGTGNNAGPIIMWTTEDASAHATVMQSYKDGQAATAAAAAYASGNYASLNGITTVSALEAELEANYIKGDFVSPSAIESISEKYQGGQPGSDNITETVYSNTINITEPGFYKFSMQAFYRAASNDVTQNMHTNSVDFPPVILFFGNSETQIKSIYDEGGLGSQSDFETETVGGAPVEYNGKWYTNGQHNSVIIFQKDYYHNDVYFYASEPGEYTYGVKYMGFANANSQWFIYSPESVEISSYAAAADASDYKALQDAIDAFDGAAWGFKKDEYAPYNNMTAIEKIADAKAIDKEAENSKLLVNSLTSYLALTANVAEVNAVYNGDFALSENDGTMAGWVTDNAAGLGGALHSRAFVLESGMNNYDNLAAFGQGDATRSCAYFRFDGTNSAKNTKYTYGTTDGYTMPLEAGTVYKLTAQAGGWGQTSKNFQIAVVSSADESVVAQKLTTPSTAISSGGNAIDYEMYFVVPANGNYKLVLTNPDDVNNAVAVSNIKLVSTDAMKFAINVAPTENGTIEVASAFAAENEEVTITATPAEGYVLASLSVTGVTSDEAVIVSDDNKFEMPADAVTVSATFAKIYAVNIAEGIENGTVAVDTTKAKAGDVVTITATPAEGYALASISVTGVTSEIAVEVIDNKFTMPADAVTVNAKFAKVLQDAWIQAIADTAYSDGKAIEPVVVVKDGETTLVENTDYTVSFTDNVNPGTATVTVTAMEGSEKYCGTASATFVIKTNKSKLVTAISLAEESYYLIKDVNPELAGNMAGVIDDAKTLNGDPDATQDVIDQNTNNLLSAIEAAQQEIALKRINITIPAKSYVARIDADKRQIDPLNLIDGVSLYSVKSVTGREVELTAALTVVDAEMPYLIYNNNDEEKTISIVVSEDPADAVEYDSEHFKGTLEGKTFTEEDMKVADHYVLQNGNSFVWVKDAGTLAAGKCWIERVRVLDNPARSLRIVAEGQITGIDAAPAAGNGIKADGKYLKNGKIIIIKNGKEYGATGVAK